MKIQNSNLEEIEKKEKKCLYTFSLNESVLLELKKMADKKAINLSKLAQNLFLSWMYEMKSYDELPKIDVIALQKELDNLKTIVIQQEENKKQLNN